MITASTYTYQHRISGKSILVVALAGCSRQCPGCRQGDPRYAEGTLYAPDRLAARVLGLVQEHRHDRIALIGGNLLAAPLLPVWLDVVHKGLPQELPISLGFCQTAIDDNLLRKLSDLGITEIVDPRSAKVFSTHPRTGMAYAMSSEDRAAELGRTIVSRLDTSTARTTFIYYTLDEPVPGWGNPLNFLCLSRAVEQKWLRHAQDRSMIDCEVDGSAQDMAPEYARVIHPLTGQRSEMEKATMSHMGTLYPICWKLDPYYGTLYAFDTFDGEYLFSKPFTASRVFEPAESIPFSEPLEAVVTE